MTEEKQDYNVNKPPAVTLVGIVETIKKVPSRQVVQVIIEVPVETFKQAVQHFDNEMVFVQVASRAMKELPYGVHTANDADAPKAKPVAESAPVVKNHSAGEAVVEKAKIGKNCIEAIEFCKDVHFQVFMHSIMEAELGEQAAKEELCIRCGVDSRKEFDADLAAHAKAQDIYKHFISWKREQEDMSDA